MLEWGKYSGAKKLVPKGINMSKKGWVANVPFACTLSFIQLFSRNKATLLDGVSIGPLDWRLVGRSVFFWPTRSRVNGLVINLLQMSLMDVKREGSAPL